tara:strand:- start:43 stop:417 length:375 start_codon:yes stop_codon:yes gene_type:complete
VVDKLVGIYNANGSFTGEIAFLFGKFTGRTECALCDITHGPLKKKSAFFRAQQTLGIPFEILHLDELDATVCSFKESAPCVVAIRGSECSILLSKAELALCDGDVTNLFEVLKVKISEVIFGKT